MLKLAIQTNLSLIPFLGHCCWRLRSFNSFAQFLNTAGKVFNKYLECWWQIMNYLTIFDRFPFIFGYLIQVVKEVGVKTRKQVFFHWSASCKIRISSCAKKLLWQGDLLFQISCAPKRFLVQYLLYTNAKGSEPNISACVEHARGAWRPPWLEIFSSSRLCNVHLCFSIKLSPIWFLSSTSHCKSFAELGDSRTKQPKRSIKEVFKKRSV